MRDGDQRLDAVFLELVEHAVIESEALFVRLGLVALREDAAPGDGEAVRLEAHFGEERDVLGVAVVEVDRHLLEVVVGGRVGARGQDALGHDVLDRKTLAAFEVGAFDLIGGGGAAPEEAIGE